MDCFLDRMPKEKEVQVVATGPSTWTLLFVAIAGGIIAVSFQPLVLALYAHLNLPASITFPPQAMPVVTSATPVTTTIAVHTTTTTTTTTTIATTTIASIVTQATTTQKPVKPSTPEADLTVDEEPIRLNEKPVKIDVTSTTTIKPAVKSEEKSQKVKVKKNTEPPELVDVTGQNREIPDEVKNFKSTQINQIKTKKLWIPIPNSNGGHRRVPSIAIRPGKEHSTSIKHWLFDEFLSQDECRSLIQVHKEHLKKMKEIDPIICFDSVQTLRKHLKDLQPDTKFYITPNDFVKGTTCVNETFSSTLKQWGLKWSYSTAFYPGESTFSKILAKRIEDGTNLQATHGGKFQITSTEKGIGYKTHRDCTLNGLKQDRYATVLIYLNTVMEGGETEFPELEIKIKPKEGRAIVWNNMNDQGECEEKSLHSANIVGDDQGKFVLQRWYYYENFFSLGKRPPEPPEPSRKEGQARVSCDEYDMGSCRAYDEWNYDHLLKYRNVNHNLI